MKKVKSVFARLTKVDAILWGQMFLTVALFSACEALIKPDTQLVLLNSGRQGNPIELEIAASAPIKVGECIEMNGQNFIVVELLKK